MKRIILAVLLCVAAARLIAQEPPWNPNAIKDWDCACLSPSLIHHVEAAPFVTIPYGLGNGWTPGSGR